MNSSVRKLVFFVLVVGMAFASYQYMIMPANRELNAQQEKLVQKKAKLRELQNAPSVVEDIEEQLVRLEKSIEILESKLPSEDQIHTVLEDVTVIAQKNGLHPKSIRTLRQKSKSGYIEQPIKMELNGNFNSYYSFLLALEKLDRITKIRELTLTKDPAREGYSKANFVLSIFFQNSSV